MSLVEGLRARHEIAGRDYATPAVLSHLQSPWFSFLAGATSIVDPFRSSLPATYERLPPGIADRIALWSDSSMFLMDYWQVRRELDPTSDERQGMLFDPDDVS
jgi:hypothetical protein